MVKIYSEREGMFCLNRSDLFTIEMSQEIMFT